MTAKKYQEKNVRKSSRSPYQKIAMINGEHPLQEAAPGSYVSYPVRKRKKGRVCFFNFDLAKLMGLIPKNHSYGLNEELCDVLLETFGIIIINEYDFINGKKFNKEDIKEKLYMATRYLQMQHKSRTGLTSGDGRGIWNGSVKSGSKVWDITSNGTGATCLSPAAANNNIFYESGDPSISYGCGYAELQDAIGNTVFSEILHKNGIPTERTLCIIEFPGDFCVAVRAGENLLRPSHFFNHLKQGRYRRLKNTFDFFLKRESENNRFKGGHLPMKKRYDAALIYLAESYAKMCAKFESDYVFCWLDWDGDNMLANGGIIDYGSIRQMGICHHQYRFDDDVRWSTNLLEQRQKGRYIIQTFAQLIDYLKTGRKKSRDKFKNHRILKTFDTMFERSKNKFLLSKVGFTEEQGDWLMASHRRLVQSFQGHFDVFERLGSKEGEVKVEDGKARFAIFNMRNLLRDLPILFSDQECVEPSEFMELMKSSYAVTKDLQLTPARVRRINRFQKDYLKMINLVASRQGCAVRTLFKQLAKRSGRVNRADRVTGDGMFFVGEALYKNRKRLSSDEWSLLIRDLVESQYLDPEKGIDDVQEFIKNAKGSKKELKKLCDIINTYREGL